MDEHRIVQSLLLRIARGVPATARLAQAILEWAQPHADWLLPGRAQENTELGWDALLAGIADACPPDEPCPHVLQLAAELAGLLGFEPFDSALIGLVIACDRLPRAAALAGIAAQHGHDLPVLLGELAGAEPHDAGRAVRRSAPLRLGLAGFVANRQGEIEVEVRWTLGRLLDRAPGSASDMIEALVGKCQPPSLSLDDFETVPDASFLTRLLAGAVRERAAGINILIHGPPGTGKTELARTLAAAAGAVLHAVGEVDDEGDEPTRWERVNALQIAQRLLAGRGGAVLLFDEMEDLIGEARPSGGDWFARREGSKVFVNRMLSPIRCG